ncbi:MULTISPECIES: DUF5615 family PIN-like protein [Cyanophyceae]|uniref:DUF5615 family PIN-like protein n=1 Tax=Cyanophyceae TaxID=3028117 RepID=UPI001686905A|nr:MULTISPECIES: DUF5615 family PIN-like protein [Cyanophyceae]MBD1916995.1 DUF5615 family PIN-like protein [Phormidium sp. FACHB-77]MBD2029846.1 DUF5615 family PIN-like protein [Phormidium sp. FACHB-322]MBD2050366.1 DUF5615 family PIN-like protein [Leptolyngbya sp. FACHB-60]
MARLYADEQFPRPAIEALRRFGHKVTTIQEAGQAGAADPDVLTFAIANQLTVLTQNRRDFIKLHQLNPNHAGIIVCSENRDFLGLAQRINDAICNETSLQGKLLRVIRLG